MAADSGINDDDVEAVVAQVIAIPSVEVKKPPPLWRWQIQEEEQETVEANVDREPLIVTK